MEEIVIRGSYFFYEKSGAQFFIRGIKYQYDGNTMSNSVRYSDSLEDGLTCARDIPYMKTLGINAIMVDWLKPDADHSACMIQFQAAGIYVLAGLSGPNESIFQTQAWDRDLQKRHLGVIESLSAHSNLLGFYVVGSPITLPLVRAAVRDLKQHLIIKEFRNIPIGFLVSVIRGKDLSQALNCGDKKSSISFLALEFGLLCSNLSQTWSAAENIAAQYVDFSVPLFFSGSQCDPRAPASTESTGLVYSPNITKVLSGAFMFSYFDNNRDNVTGIVGITGDKVNTGPDFTAISSEIASAQPSSTHMAEYKPTNSAPSTCSSLLTVSVRPEFETSAKSTVMQIATNVPPTPDSRLCECMMESLNCVADHKFTPGPNWIPGEPTEPEVAFPAERELVQTICGQNGSWCLGSRVDTRTGQYGTFSVCNSTERGSWMLNQLYKSRAGDPVTCSSAGGALRQRPSSLSQPNDCSMLLRQAGPQGTGIITHSPLPGDQNDSRSTLAGHNSLATSGEIGLGVGIAFFVLLSTAGGFLWFRRRKKKEISSSPMDGLDDFRKAELPGTPVALGRNSLTEIDGYERNEIDGNSRAEADFGERLFELPTPYNEGVELEASKNRKSGASGKDLS